MFVATTVMDTVILHVTVLVLLVTNTTPNSMTSEVRAATTKVGVTTSLAGTKWASRE